MPAAGFAAVVVAAQRMGGCTLAMYQAVLFDVDGTIVHSRPGILHSFAHTFRTMGLDPDTIDLSAYLGPPLRRSFAEHFARESDVERAVSIYRQWYAEHGMHECSVFDGVRPMLARLRQAGVFLATATSKPTQVVRPILEELGLLNDFDLVCGASMDKSVDTKAAVIRQALTDVRVAGKRVLMVGDRRDDMQGAADCGLPAAGVLYGYGTRQELQAWHPVFLAPDCESLTQYILTG